MPLQEPVENASSPFLLDQLDRIGYQVLIRPHAHVCTYTFSSGSRLDIARTLESGADGRPGVGTGAKSWLQRAMRFVRRSRRRRAELHGGALLPVPHGREVQGAAGRVAALALLGPVVAVVVVLEARARLLFLGGSLFRLTVLLLADTADFAFSASIVVVVVVVWLARIFRGG